MTVGPFPNDGRTASYTEMGDRGREQGARKAGRGEKEGNIEHPASNIEPWALNFEERTTQARGAL